MKEIDSLALFRLSVLGPMVSREQLGRGELQGMIRELAQREYAIPGSQRRRVGEKTIEAWYSAELNIPRSRPADAKDCVVRSHFPVRLILPTSIRS